MVAVPQLSWLRNHGPVIAGSLTNSKPGLAMAARQTVIKLTGAASKAAAFLSVFPHATSRFLTGAAGLSVRFVVTGEKQHAPEADADSSGHRASDAAGRRADATGVRAMFRPEIGGGVSGRSGGNTSAARPITPHGHDEGDHTRLNAILAGLMGEHADA